MAAKIKDGLFIGDAETSQSEVFINDNKISNLINLSGKEVPNIWASHGLVYLTYNWEDRPDYRLFSSQDDTILTDIVEFVDVSIAHGISVLLFSKRGTGRCVIAACLYLMMKYRWGFEKSYDYVYSKKPDIDLNKGFIQQMFALDMKLLAARQKAYALKHGIENGFRIEPNMTINDIAAMLPPTEAKRWNSWDPNYILAPNNVSVNDANSQMIGEEDMVTWQKYSDSVINALRKKDALHARSMTNKQKVTWRVMDDAEEELVLIFSFINSKNTITSLPGPYHNAYDIQKSFKLRFDNVLFEEDINMFPSSPVNLRYGYIPRSILKGGKHRNNQIAGSGNHSNAGHSQNVYHMNEYLPPSDEKATTTTNTVSSTRNSIDGFDTSRLSTTSTTNTANDELYRYVGVASEAKTVENTYPLSKKREDKNAPSYPEAAAPVSHHNPPPASSSMWTVEDDQKAGMSAEERLRKLMADMQRSNHFPDHLKGEGTNSGNNNSKNNNSNSNNTTTSRNLPPPQQSKNEPFDDHYYSSSTSISLHDLANMPVQTSSGMGDAKATADPFRRSYDSSSAAVAAAKSNTTSHGRNTSNNPMNGRSSTTGRSSDISLVDLEREDASLKPSSSTSDPLAAFDVPVASLGASTGSKGPLKARHDIAMNRTSATAGMNPTRTSTSKQAWNSTTSSSSNRPPSPSTTRPASPMTARNVSSNSSVGSVGSNSGGAAGSNYVGSGTTSSAKVYRHGSPAPNTRPAFGRSAPSPQPSPRQQASSNLSVNSNSITSLGSGLSNIPPNSNVRASYTPPTSNRPASSSSSSGQRYSSPFAANPSYSSNNNNSSTPQRRGSFSSVNSVGSTGSNNPPPSSSSAADRRRSYGTSPMRASYSGGNPNATSISSKRFSTPTPQSEQHNNANNLSSSRAVRSSTPTKNTWKF